MHLKFISLKILILVLAMLVPVSAFSQATFNGMNRVADWTDFENQSNEMPAQVWGSCDVTQEDSIGIKVDFDDETSGTTVYTGVSALWNTTNFAGLAADSSTGFFQNCSGMHFLTNTGTGLPLAWQSCNMVFASNFDLDYNEKNGSHFRATTTGWVSARFQTYCGDGQATLPPSVGVPALSLSNLIILGALLGLLGIFSLKKRSKHL